MINELEERQVQCPYCGEIIGVVVDCSIPKQHYIEDCQVCCRPIHFEVTMIQEGEFTISASHEDE